MDKQQLRQYIRSQKRAMTPQAIAEKSALLAEKLRAVGFDIPREAYTQDKLRDAILKGLGRGGRNA